MHSRVVIVAGTLVAALLLGACGGSGGPGVANLGGAGSTPSPSAGGGSKADNALAFSQCMRQHGVTNFPDPGSRGNISINGGPGSGLDPSSPQFQSAQNACKSLLPNGGAPDPSQQAAFQAAALAFSKCMRAHGIADFPDPQFGTSGGGGFVKVQLPQSLSEQSPQFQAAQKACQSLLPGRPDGAVSAQGGGAGVQGSGGGAGK